MGADYSKISPYEHVIAAIQFDKPFLSKLFAVTDAIRENPEQYQDTLRGKVIATLFFEPSTRTRLSFEAAIQRLGGSVITVEDAAKHSSATKGETLHDSLRVVSGYADCIIMRHNSDTSGDEGAESSLVPFINAGSGKTHHPTQSLLDIYTIHRELGKTSGLKVGIVGDLLRGRTVDSLVQVLTNFEDNEFYFVSPENSRAKDSLKEMLDDKGIKYTQTDNLESVISEVDVLYVTRVQKERCDSEEEYAQAAGKFIVTGELADIMQESAIIMHPLPRVDEIAVEVDENPRSKCFDQAENGMWVRMALLKMLNDGK